VLASVNKLRVGVTSVCYCAMGFALFLILFAFSHSFLLSFFFLAMIGFSQISGRALSNTAIQTATPPNLLGRVLSLFFMDRGLWSLGSVIIGTAAAAIGINWTFALCGAVCAGAAIALLMINRRYHAEAARHAADYVNVTQQSDL
jgi:MFS family permease